MRPIYVLHENEEWLVPLRAEFAARGVEFNEWFLDTGTISLDKTPEDAVYYNRMSASSHTRGHRFAPELTRMALTWLEQHGRTVVNGTPALYLEVCKVSQYAALQKAGLDVPSTRAVVGRHELVPAAQAFGVWPLILKPNRGGKGLGVMRFNTLDELRLFVDSAQYEEPLDGLWLLQAYIQPKAPHITRCEFVGRRFVYAVDVNTEQGFELCPADVCAVGDAFCPTTEAPTPAPSKFTITQRFDGHPLIEKLETFLHHAQVDVAGIEVIEAADGRLYVYDVNTNTNYNQGAERVAGVKKTGMGALADYLIALADTRSAS
ncbi:ATP-grasp domain-containing protein [Aliidiomarina sanyensis]|uniref:Alpha-L-glutamate ligase n=1 Tax=Aliidiomarina sanyensis TaxID=1249555 RepID=A0A432WK89_9GAMM|nr:alpha-L-glutamate ligase [Aliidiomarina sanyensis]RUO34220.1 alpha-L-glutamate ligase [Aliidiomarina sanyensis]